MKKNSVFLVMILLLVAAWVGCKTTENVVKQSTNEAAYSYVHIDPLAVGETWEHIITIPLNQMMAEMYFRNPDEDAAIKLATLVVSPGGVGGYSYMLNGKIDVCVFNDKTNAYESIWDTLDDESKAQWRADYKEHFRLGGA